MDLTKSIAIIIRGNQLGSFNNPVLKLRAMLKE